jgi:hypothetical protein
MATPGFYDDFLEDEPDILFQASRPQTRGPGVGGNFLDYWRGRTRDVYQDYLGGLGRQALAGQEPTGSFQSFLGDYPWQDFWRSLSPSQRGDRSSTLAPRLRYNF